MSEGALDKQAQTEQRASGQAAPGSRTLPGKVTRTGRLRSAAVQARARTSGLGPAASHGPSASHWLGDPLMDAALRGTPLPAEISAPVQARATQEGASSEEVKQLAARGTAGSAGSLPHMAAVQRSFGHHDVSGIRAHTGGEAGGACDAMGAAAYASDNDVAFASGSPDLHTVAHEAAHVVQQRGGVQLRGGVGAAGDHYEQHADAVADRVVRGESAEPLLDQVAGGQQLGSSGGGQDHVQKKDLDVAGGKFKFDPYEVWDGDPGNDSDKRAGLKFEIEYTSPEHVVSDKIGFIQVMKCIKGDGKPLLFANEKPRATDATDGEAGWAVDRVDGKKHGNYGRDNDGTESGAAGNMTFGSRTDATTHTDAWMYDRTNLPRKAGQTFDCNAHVYAVDIQNSEYLGGANWGYKIDAKGDIKENDPKVSSEGGPTGFQRRAVEKWNEQADLADAGKRNHADQVKLPLEGNLKTKVHGVWLVSNPSKYKDTVICKLAMGTVLEVETEGPGKSFNKTDDAYKWTKVRVADGSDKGKTGWVMKANLEGA